MTHLLTAAYLVIAFALFWYSANSDQRSRVHRAMLYAFGFAAMCFGTARFLVLFGAEAGQWRWMIEAGHVSLIAFAVMWVRREVGLKEKLERKRL